MNSITDSCGVQQHTWHPASELRLLQSFAGRRPRSAINATKTKSLGGAERCCTDSDEVCMLDVLCCLSALHLLCVLRISLWVRRLWSSKAFWVLVLYCAAEWDQGERMWGPGHYHNQTAARDGAALHSHPELAARRQLFSHFSLIRILKWAAKGFVHFDSLMWINNNQVQELGKQRDPFEILWDKK